MNKKNEFQEIFEPRVNQFESCKGNSLSETGTNVPNYELIAEMLEWTFGFSAAEIETLVMGKKFHYVYEGKRDSYRLGGIDALYGGSAVWVTYETICFYLETGWWPMGLDKASVTVPDPTKDYWQPKTDVGTPYERQYRVHYYGTNDFVVACTGAENPEWYYTTLLIKPDYILPFIKGFKDGMVFEGVKLEFEDAEFIGSGFSATDIKELAWKIDMK
jgi:hypothetical protein